MFYDECWIILRGLALSVRQLRKVVAAPVLVPIRQTQVPPRDRHLSFSAASVHHASVVGIVSVFFIFLPGVFFHSRGFEPVI